MTMNNCNISRDGSKYYCSMDINIEDNKKETNYAQRIFNLGHDVSIVSDSAVPILSKYGNDIIEMIKDKYPEDIISTDFGKFVEYLDVIDAK